MKYDAKMKRKVTRDWESENPSFKFLKPGRLIGQNGPLLVGICFDSTNSSDEYMPIAHVHNICYPFTFISLGLVGEVLNDVGLPTRVKVSKHDDIYQEFVTRIKEDYPYIDKVDMNFNDLIIATQKYINRNNTNRFEHLLYNNIITISAYLGQMEYAFEALDEFTDMISKWPESAFNIIGSVDEWRNGLLELIENPEKLHENIEQEIIKHKIPKLNDYGLAWPEKPLKLWEMYIKPMDE
ncbi:MAG: hypothetical protein AB6733_24595 [Clostridiaceae bacterium]